MPPRSRYNGATPITIGDPTESRESRIKRLRPDLVINQVATSAAASSSILAAPPPPQVAATAADRPDANVVRNLRRGSIADATDAVTTVGMESLIAELVRDRVAATGVTVNCSLVKTWHTLHTFAYRSVIPSVPVLPITPRSLVAVASLFKRGGVPFFPQLPLGH